MLNLRNLLIILCFSLFVFGQISAQTSQTDPKKDLLYRAKGDNKRTYWFADANAQSPYRVYVPTTWDGKKKLPLVVILHGGGLTQDAPFERAPDNIKGIVQKEAEKQGFIIVAPLGFSPNGGYGSMFTPPPGPPAGGIPPAGQNPPPAGAGGPPVMTPEERKKMTELSEKDVLNVIALVEKEYNTDKKNTFLMGNSMGEIGTLHLTQKYPKMWRAIAPSGGPIDAADYPFANVKVKGAFFIQGELDKGPRDNHARQKALADGFKAQGIDTKFEIVTGGTHPTAWFMVLPEIFEFFETHKSK